MWERRIDNNEERRKVGKGEKGGREERGGREEKGRKGREGEETVR